MIAKVDRKWDVTEAARQRVPLLIGLTGASSSGKTFSALRLATGIQRVTGGDIVVIDTEAKRALHYADKFRFKHLPFGEPFSPLDYLSAVEHCVKIGAKVVVIDSASHEHEGPGGVLEMHAEEVERRSGGDWNKAQKVNMACWAKPKSMRRRMINTVTQLPIHTIWCFRAKQKMKVERGKEPTPLGWMAISGDEFLFEMTVNFLLYPKSDGVPTWDTTEPGEKAEMKLPEQFRSMLRTHEPISEDMGEAMARWAEGGQVESPVFDGLYVQLDECQDMQGLESVAAKVAEAVRARSISNAERGQLEKRYKERFKELKEVAA